MSDQDSEPERFRREQPQRHRPLPSRGSSALSSNDKLEMSLDDVIQTERRMPRRDDKDEKAVSAEGSAKATKVHRAMEQMGLTHDSKHIRRGPQVCRDDGDEHGLDREWKGRGKGGRGKRDGWKGGKGEGGNRHGKNHNRSHAENVQRWISYVVKNGHLELGLMKDEDGWIGLDGLVSAMARIRPDLGFDSSEKLRAFLSENDDGGRWEVMCGRIRKLPREMRQGRSSVQGHSHSSGGIYQPKQTGTRRGRSCSSSVSSHGAKLPASRSCSPCHEGDDAADTLLAGNVQRSLRVSGDVEFSDSGGAFDRDGAPPPPPGDHWTQFVDGDAHWWYYEGPLGYWWTAGTDSQEVLRYDP